MCKAAIMRDLNRLEKWTDNKLTKPNENRLKVWSRLMPCNDRDLDLVDLLEYFARMVLQSPEGKWSKCG